MKRLPVVIGVLFALCIGLPVKAAEPPTSIDGATIVDPAAAKALLDEGAKFVDVRELTQADGRSARGGQPADVHPEHRLPVARAAARLAGRDQWRDQRPFLIGQVARIAQPVAVVARAVFSGPLRTPRMGNQGPQGITPDSHTSSAQFAQPIRRTHKVSGRTLRPILMRQPTWIGLGSVCHFDLVPKLADIYNSMNSGFEFAAQPCGREEHVQSHTGR